MIQSGDKLDALRVPDAVPVRLRGGRMPAATREPTAPPEFGDAPLLAGDPPGPRELFCRLVNAPAENVHAIEPAFGLVRALLATDAPGPAERDPESFAAALVSSVDRTLPLRDVGEVRYAPSWPVRVAREYAPVGLTDGVWLQGAVRVNAVEDAVGMTLLRQLMIRFGGPGVSESYARRYASLLGSVGVVPDSITRWHRADDAACVELSFERALLGVGLALFPRLLRAETLGFNLWMARIGPCPLLEQLAVPLRARGASLAYLDAHDRAGMAALATAAISRYLADDNTEERRRRIWCGFSAAHRAYLRWEQAMRGRNVPMTARQCVLDMLRRKAEFAIGHHDGVALASRDLDSYLAAGPRGHARLLEAFAASRWITPGKPEASSFVRRSISADGPMFDAFTPDEIADLRDWIAGLAESDIDPPPIELAGVYGPARDPDRLEQYALARYGALGLETLAHCLVNADEHPTIRLFARTAAHTALDRLANLLDTDDRLASARHPAYSARALEELLAAYHARNVRDRLHSKRDGTEASHPAWLDLQDVLAAKKRPSVLAILDGYWLQGFTDVSRIDREEYGWLFRINMSELGDGELALDHNVIARNFLSHLGADAWLPPTDPAMYSVFEVPPAFVTNMGMVLDTERFLPELLGLNLAIEAASVGGMFKTVWKQSARHGAPWAALYFRLHNSIDNYATGHTRWSIDAIHAYLARVAAVAPSAVDEHWRRIWRIWRAHELVVYGTPAQRALLRSIERDPGGMS